MIPFKTIITYDKTQSIPVYIQISNQIIQLIKRGILSPETKLPSSRALAAMLNIHRKTVISVYEELLSQGWIEIIPYTGTFVSGSLPIVKKQTLNPTDSALLEKNKAGFSYIKSNLNYVDIINDDSKLFIDDGLPDNRLSMVNEIATAYRSIVKRKKHHILGYDSIYGNLRLRETLVQYLNQTRGLSIQKDQLLTTRGSQMGIYLATKIIGIKNGTFVVGAVNYKSVVDTFNEASASVSIINVDKEGLVTNEIELLCKQKKVAAIYVTSHHNHPTTVALSAQRRMHLLELARQYRFAVIEDDYDYDFHYDNAPILPLASNDTNGNVIYIGSLTKTVAPAIRVGYLVAPKDFIFEAAQQRKFIDRQGDTLLELAIAQIIDEGSLQRHCKKVLKIYKRRRDLLCSLLKKELNDYLSFDVPDGGMAIWVRLNKKYNWDVIRNAAANQKLILNDYRLYDYGATNHNAIRMGFASLNETEIVKTVSIIKSILLDTYEEVQHH
ncbi:PLP-dependent aminotransferase family protein [Flagellimonas sp. CMM7]|uniref:MocR-like pyridoxine biosynthesis transcription factor PdxR n=1 Tax=Flagellimonas sp. CMM7 TaxID=2654676 RepID=UPI0013D85BD0|nr:PLP-dependent aminotransferase family protein [Flagellimonas sp. CMM7]UII81064.1 PLP-dependent aminotransferase family protein [Flagellimonas sp. CMM7]